MPRRRKTRVPLHMRAANAGGALLFGVWDKAAQRPMDFAALLTAAVMSTIVVVNAVYLQTGSRSAPYFVPPPATAGAGTGAATGAAPHAAATAPSSQPSPSQVTGTASSPRLIAPGVVTPQPVAARRDDPIADLIAPQPSPRLTSVQRALSEFGYGQIKPTGVLDEPTSAAIQKFERDHKMPVTGRVSERLVGELTAMVGHPLN